MAVVVIAVTASGLLAGACGDDDVDDGAVSSTSTIATTTQPIVEPAPSMPDVQPESGTGVVVIGGGEAVTLEVVGCTIDASAQPEGQVPAELVSATAGGTTASGAELLVEVRRFRSLGASPTVTDTVTLVEGDPEAPDRALVAQRFEVDGLVTDLRDPDADDPLLRVSGSTIEGSGVFAPPGDTVGSVEARLRVVCS